MTLMFQREVAERITARPGEAAYGRLSVLTRWLADAEIFIRCACISLCATTKNHLIHCPNCPAVTPRYPVRNMP